MRFFVDNNLPPRLTRALSVLLFLRRGWTRSKSLSLFELTGRLIMRWPEIVEIAQRHERGTAFEVPLTGKIRPLS